MTGRGDLEVQGRTIQAALQDAQYRRNSLARTIFSRRLVAVRLALLGTEAQATLSQEGDFFSSS